MRRLLGAVTVLVALGGQMSAASSSPAGRAREGRLSFWDVQRRGANFFNEVETRDRFRAAKAAGIEWVRLVPDKWEGAKRIVAAEFGCDRRAAGAQDYLADIMTTLNERGWHWAFYAFREDAWDRMDYELGAGGLGAAYWEAIERGEHPDRPWKDNPLWHVLQAGLKAGR